MKINLGDYIFDVRQQNLSPALRWDNFPMALFAHTTQPNRYVEITEQPNVEIIAK